MSLVFQENHAKKPLTQTNSYRFGLTELAASCWLTLASLDTFGQWIFLVPEDKKSSERFGIHWKINRCS